MDQPRCLGVLNHDPLVIYASLESFLPLKHNVLDLLEEVTERPYAMVVQVGRALHHLVTERPSLLDGIAAAVRRHDLAFPKTRVWFACHTPADLLVAQERGLQARVLYPHVFVNDLALRLKPLVKKHFDALLIAPMHASERHELVALIEALTVVPRPMHLDCPGGSRSSGDAPPADPTAAAGARRLQAVKEALPHAHYLEFPDSADELSNLISRSRVGVCLADHDDPAPEPLRYWLSGVPVVSTAVSGHRDPLYDPSRAQFCAPTQAGVANAVSLLIARNLDPIPLRRGVLTRLWTFRNEWRQLMAHVCTAMGNPAGNHFEDQFKALRDLDTGLNLTTIAALGHVIRHGAGVVDPAPKAVADTLAADQ